MNAGERELLQRLAGGPVAMRDADITAACPLLEDGFAIATRARCTRDGRYRGEMILKATDRGVQAARAPG